MPWLSYALHVLSLLAPGTSAGDDVVVTVVDSNGVPVSGMPVTLRREGAVREPSRLLARSFELGRARFEDVVRGRPLEACVLLPWPVCVSLPEGEQTATVRLPAVGERTLRIRGCEAGSAAYLVDERGQDRWTLLVMSSVARPLDHRRHLYVPLLDGPASAVDSDGMAFFPVVGLGRPVRVVAVAPSGEASTWTLPALDGPDDRETIELTWDPPYALLEAALTGPDDPSTARLVRSRARFGEREVPHVVFRSAPSLRLALDRGGEASGGLLTVEVEYRTPDGRHWSGRLDRRGPFPVGETALEPIRLEPMEPLTGRVVGGRGEPVPDARVGLELHGDGRDPETRTDEHGGFALYGLPADSEHVLWVYADGFLEWRRPVRAGGDLEVRLVPSLDVRSRLLLPEGVSPRILDVHVRREGNGEAWEYRRLDGNELTFRMPPGRASVEVRLGARWIGGHVPIPSGNPVLQRSANLVSPESGGPVDFGPLDLTQLLSVIRIAIVDSEKDPIAGARLKMAGMLLVAGEPVVIVTDRESISVQAEANGYRSESRERVAADVEIVLERAR